jgi:tetratricopeptide (TPR) repeat protein
MAPEHLASFGRLPAPFPTTGADGRSDVYALGVILYELLTGRRPFPQPSGTGQAMLEGLIQDRLRPPPRVRHENRSVTPAVESILRHCLEPDPARRYQSARQLAEDLERQRNHLPLAHARETSPREQAAKWLRRNRRRTSLAVGVVAIGLILCLAGALAARGQRLGRLEAGANLAAFNDERDEASLLLASRLDDADQRAEGLRRADRALARYSVVGHPDWREQPAVRLLPPEERRHLAESVGELLLLVAVTDPERKELAEQAAACFAPDEAPRALFAQRAELAERRGEKDEAGALRAEAERRPVHNATDHYLLARERYHAGRFVEAVEHLRAAVKLDPKHFSAWFLLGNCCLDGAAEPGKREDEAVRCYTACIALRPRFFGAHYNRGLAHLRKKRYADAEEDFSKALELAPNLADAHLHRGLAREGQGRRAEALADLTRAIDLDTPSTRAFFTRARLRRALGNVAGAESDQKMGLDREPRTAESYVCRGAVRAKSDVGAARKDFQSAVRLSPYSLPGRYNEAFLLSERLGQTQEALHLLGDLVERYPNQARVRAARGILRARLGQREAAHEDRRIALTLENDSGEVLFQAACIQALTARTQQDADKALDLLAKALGRGFGHDRLLTCPDLVPLRASPRFWRIVGAAQEMQPPPRANRAPRPGPAA